MPTVDLRGVLKANFSSPKYDSGYSNGLRGFTFNQTLTPALFTNSQTFPAPTVARGAVTLTPALFTNTNTFYGATVAQPGAGTLIARADWSVHDVTPSTIQSGATWSVYGGVCTKVSDYFRILYPDTTSGGMSAGVALLLDGTWNLPEIYVEFDARLPAGMVGPKFYKVHGDNSGTDYANTTYGLESGSGNMDKISFGDGVDTGNDVANVLFLDGAYPSWTGRNYGVATVVLKSPPASFVWDSNWHTFRIRHKYNSGTTSGNEVNDGLYYIEIDGVVYVSATGMFNRHYLNTRRVNQLTFGDWVQNDEAAEVNFRDIKVSTGGFV